MSGFLEKVKNQILSLLNKGSLIMSGVHIGSGAL